MAVFLDAESGTNKTLHIYMITNVLPKLILKSIKTYWAY